MHSSAGPRFRLSLFGPPTLFRDDQRIPLTPLQLALVTLVYGSDSEEIPRARVAWLLWEEDLDTRTRHRLSQLI